MTAGKKPRGKPFAKGRSGNPAGRPKLVADVRALAQAQIEPAINTLVQIANDKAAPPAARVAAANAILDRAVGKPAQAITGEGGEGAVVVQIVRYGAADSAA